MFALGVAFGAAAAGGGAWYRLKLDKAEIERAALHQAEQKYQQELRAARKRYEEVEQARIDAEQQASHSAAVQAATKREADMTRAELRAAAAKAAREARARQKDEERLRLEAAERKRAEEAAAAAASTRTAAVVPRSVPVPPPAPAPPTQTAQASPEALCRSMTNFITRGICETRECIKPQYMASDYCRSLRARASPSPTQP